jgi:hypothetical protein
MSILASPVPPPASAGGFVTFLNARPAALLSAGLPDAIVDIFESDYPAFTYQNANAVDGVLTISALSPFQNGLQGGLNIVARFNPLAGTHAPHRYEWLQYLTIAPLSVPFLGAGTSPFTDPPPAQRDDALPFYWTATQRTTPGLGYVSGWDIEDNPRFSDAPRLNNSRAPVDVQLYLYLSDFDAATNTVTVYDGVQYGFRIAALPEPATLLFVLGGLGLLLLARCADSIRGRQRGAPLR